MYPYVIFDLDGTLLNTIDDLANAGNHVCRLHGWPTHSVDEFKRMVGNGIPKLVERFAPEGTGAPVLEQALGEFMAWYGVHKADQTAPYPGMLQAVRRLKEAGVSIAVLSNKADEMAGPVVEGYYPQIFPLVQGALTGIPTKPDPTLLHRLMERMGASQENTLFVGDSNVDIQTAKNGGLTSCGVLWGFRSRQELEQEGADYLASTPEDLLTLILGEKGGRETRHLGPEDVEEAAAILRSGGLVGIPTETVYGLGANGLDPEAVAHIFEAKGRPQDNPLILHIPSADHLERYCADIPQSAFDLARACWPGPLTMILKRRPIVPDVVTAGMDTVGMRCPSHPVCRAILQAAEVPVAAPSGNTSGRPSPTTAGHMAEDMDGKIDGIVDGGPCAVGVESTIIDLTVTPPRLLRPGGLPLEALEEVLGTVAVDKAVTGLLKDGEKPRAPGMKYRHYAPKAPVTAVTGDPAHSALVIRGLLREKAGVICFDEFAGYFEGHIVHRLGPFTDKLAQAQRVFDALRTFDGTDVTEIFAQCPDDAGLGLAVGNRLKKAAGFHLIDGDAPVVIGITGGTGSGKTSALQALEALGGTVLDCDAVYHQALREDETLRRRIRDAFGEVFRGTELDRQKLGSLVFSDPQALERLNGIIFDYLPGVLRRRMEGRVLVGLDAINLIESGLGELCCRTVAVLAPGEQRVQRIMQRDHIPEEYARLRIQAQKPDSYYREHCTDVLENQEETPEAFREKAEIFFRDLLRQLHHITEGGHEQ